MTDIPVQTKVETLLLLAKIDDRKRGFFYEALLDAYFYVAGTLEEQEEAGEGKLTLRYFQGENMWVLPIFTQLPYLHAALGEEQPLLTIRGKELFEQADREATIVLNLGTDLDKTFTPQEVRDLVSGDIFDIYK